MNLRGENIVPVLDYNAMFSRRMDMAGITPSDRIAIAVSGGADSMALCLLAIKWISLQKPDLGLSSVDTLTGMVVDHGLRPESSAEAICVQKWVRKLGIDCRVLKCNLAKDVLSQGHLQEAARLARYSRLEEACRKNDIEFLLTAHHADDQDELFVLRLSRHSGVAGLAGMAFTTELFSQAQSVCCKDKLNARLILVRPLLQFRKQDLYKICQNSSQEWVEDTTNQNLFFARNRIRKFLNCTPFSPLRQSLQHVIAECRKARVSLDKSRDKVLSESVLVDQEYGFVTIQTEKFLLSSIDEAILSRALAAVLQFIAQRERPPRGRVLQAVLDWIRFKRMKGAFTAAGCYLIAKPRSKGSKVLITFSPDSPQPSRYQSIKDDFTDEYVARNSCITPPKATMDWFSINFSESDSKINLANACDSLKNADWFKKAKASGLISEDAAYLLALLSRNLSQDLEHNLHGMKSNQSCQICIHDKKNGVFTSTEASETNILTPGKCKYVMDRFKVSWWQKGSTYRRDCMLGLFLPEYNDRQLQHGTDSISKEANIEGCNFWANNRYVEVRHFEEKDISYLSEITKSVGFVEKDISYQKSLGCPSKNLEKPENAMGPSSGSHIRHYSQIVSKCSFKGSPRKDKGHHRALCISCGFEKTPDSKTALTNIESCGEYMKSKAKEALSLIKLIPRPVIRGLPVFVNNCGVLLAIPNIGFQCCRFQHISAKFSPRFPLGGGISSWL
ncbi:hypothetical protein O6H91_22G057500 [Diphasiastrum complanatum]|uniref:Uncharacterized protein n=1 Tax=Diphasiastrum complanatum TaxID=34168 RepID=A0ACC2AFS0_DIPCM|nr:hypothetical protein O6H91_22G057500 [Diphasiastrum complanatum]